MTEILLSREDDLIRTQFQELGHVGIKGCFDPALAHAAARELNSLCIKQESGVPGEFREVINRFRSGSRINLNRLMISLSDQVEMLGNPWPAKPNFHLQHIEMQPGTAGRGHRDRNDFMGAVAITTLIGSSTLIVENEFSYDINPGDVAFLDAGRQLYHQGISGDDGKRIGLAVAVIA